MTFFLWVFIVLTASVIVGKLAMLARDDFPRRTAGTEAIDVALNVGLLLWAAVLLASA